MLWPLLSHTLTVKNAQNSSPIRQQLIIFIIIYEPSAATTVFPAHHHNMWQHAVSTSGTLSQQGCSFKREGKAAHATITVLHDSMVAAGCPHSGTLSSFNALMLLVGRQKTFGLKKCKSFATTIHKSKFLDQPILD